MGGGGIVGELLVYSSFYYCVCIKIIATGMALPEGRIFLNIVIYSGGL